MKKKLTIGRIAACAMCLILSSVLLSGCGKPSRVTKETDETTYGIDVAKYQGTIDWEQTAEYGVDFAMVRIGYRSMTDGVIEADSNGQYNLQEAAEHGVKLGVYFFSTAISEEEAVEEAEWVADFIAQYPITYPVVYDCEGYTDNDSRQYGMTKEERTAVALAFLERIEELGYEGMFYASKNALLNDTHWETSRIEEDYKIWVAQYSENVNPYVHSSSYTGEHQMWQYTMEGAVPGITQPVDLNVAYFGYDGTEPAKDDTIPEEVGPDVEALMDFTEVNESVTAKVETNLRSIPSQDTDSQVLYTLKNGEVATRIAVSSSGWSKVVFEGNTYYAVTSYLTTDLDYTPSATAAPEEEDDDGIKTPFQAVNEQVTAKDVVNLRLLPSVEHEGATVIAQLENGEVVTRTGIKEDLGWSRVEYNGQTLYCVSSYLMLAPQEGE